MPTCPNHAEQAAVEWNLDQLYLDLAAAKANLHPEKRAGLTPTETLHLQGLLSGYSPSDIAAQLVVDPKGINVALCKTIYRYVENLTGHAPNSIDNWREVVQWLDKAGYRNSASIDWGEAPEITTFYGREAELSQLKRWILNDRCHLAALLGIGGLGKTALAVTLVEQIKDQFEWVVWRSLRGGPSIESFLPGLLPDPAEEQGLSIAMSTVKQYVREHRCLIILDEFEELLADSPVGHCRKEYEAYGKFLRSMGTERHQSCVLITSREKPKEVLLPENKIYSLQLGSLGEAAQGILQEKNLLDENHQWDKVTQMYGGSPLALKLVAETIKDLFDGSIIRFLKENTTFIESELYDTLHQQFIRLPEPEIEVVRQLATYAQPVSISTLREAIAKINTCVDSIQVIEALRRRSLLEKIKNPCESLFTLHPIVLKYVKREYIDKRKKS
jgi:hypothetical protein